MVRFSMRILMLSINLIILFISSTSVFAEVYISKVFDQDLFFPVNCDEKGQKCVESTRSIAYKKDIASIPGKDVDEFYIPHATLEFPHQLPDSVTFSDGKFTWAPAKATDTIVIKVNVVDKAPNSFSKKSVFITLKGHYDGTPNSKNDWQRTCAEENRAWSKISQNINENIDYKQPEKQDPLPGTPSQILAFESYFANISSEEINLENKLDQEQKIISTILFDQYAKYILDPLGVVKKPIYRRAIDGLVLQAPRQVILDFIKKLPHPISYPLNVSNHVLFHELTKFGIFGNYLSEWVHCTHYTRKCNKVGQFGAITKRMTDDYLEAELTSFKTNPGIDQISLYFIYLLSKPEYNGLYLYQRDALDIPKLDVATKISNLEQKSKDLMFQKTTPSLACNNAVSDYLKEPIPWEQLGMYEYVQSLTDSYGYWLPWVHPAIVNAIGKSIYEHPQIFELIKIVPVFGTVLAILDGSLTLYYGEDVQANKVDRRLGALNMAVDLAASALGAYGMLKAVPELQSAALKMRNLKASGKLEDLVEAAHLGIDTTKKYLKYEDVANQIIPCGLAASARLDDKYDFKQKDKVSLTRAIVSEVLDKEYCRISKYKNFSQNFHGTAATLDTSVHSATGKFYEALESTKGDYIKAKRALENLGETNVDSIAAIALSYDEVRKIEGIGIKRGVSNAVIDSEMSAGGGLLNRAQIQQWNNRVKPTVVQPMVLTRDIPENFDSSRRRDIRGFFDTFKQNLRKINFGTETKADGSIHYGEKKSTIVYKTGIKVTKVTIDSGDLNVFLHFMSTYRKKELFGKNLIHLAKDPNLKRQLPKLVISDKKFALDIHKIATGEDILAKNQFNIFDAYDELLTDYGAMLIDYSITNDSLKKAGALISGTEDYSNLPFQVIYLPNNCRTALLKAMQDRIPVTFGIVSKYYNNTY